MGQFSFNKGKEMLESLIASRAVQPWKLQAAELEAFFTFDKSNLAERAALDAKIKASFQDGSAEKYFGIMIVADVVNPPSKVGAGLGVTRERNEFASREQEAHYQVSRIAKKAIEDFIAANEACQQLAKITGPVDDKGKAISIVPALHMRSTNEVMAYYDNLASTQSEKPAQEAVPQAAQPSAQPTAPATPAPQARK